MAMNLREVTVGRSANCDIYLDQGCKFASGLHGTIYYDGSQLMFKDTSTNGTWINNIKVHKRAVPIRHGDIIMLAGKYQINWNQIDAYFPVFPEPQPMMPISQPVTPLPQPIPSAPQNNYVDTSKFSWGAFWLSGIWGFFNGCWWMFLVNMGFFLLAFIPFVNIFSFIASLITNIIFGVYGMRWAWANRTWSSPQDFIQTQATWNKVAIILFIVSIAFLILVPLIFLGSLASIAASF